MSVFFFALSRRLGDRVADLRAALPHRGRRPSVRLDVPGSVPAWAVRLVTVGLGAALAGLVVDSAFGWVVTGAVLLAILARPNGWGGPLLLLVLGAGIGLSPAGPLDWQPYVLIAGSHAVLQLGALLGPSAAGARIEVGALVLPLRRYAAIQLVAQLIALVGALSLSRSGGPAAGSVPFVGWLAPATALALLVLAHAVLPVLLPARGVPRQHWLITGDWMGEAATGAHVRN